MDYKKWTSVSARAIERRESLTGRNSSSHPINNSANVEAAVTSVKNSNVEHETRKSRRLVEMKENTMPDIKPVTKSKTNLLEILDNWVCRNLVLSYIHVNDLLRLRRVCKSSKMVAEDFIRMQKVETLQPLDISFCDHFPFQEFDQFQNDWAYFPIRTNLQIGLCLQAPLLKAPATCTNHVTHLTIFNILPSTHYNSALTFVDLFPNLIHLELDLIQAPNEHSMYPQIKVPPSFRTLKSLKIMHTSNSTMQFWSRWTVHAFTDIEKLVEICIPNLERLSLPFDRFLSDYMLAKDEVIRLACLCIFSETKLSLENVPGNLMTELLRLENRTPVMRTLEDMVKCLNAKVSSIKIPQTAVFLEELPNLERIDFRNMAGCIFPYPGFRRSDWPKLKEIRVHLDDVIEDGSSRPTLRLLWDFLFARIVRWNLVELHISYSGVEKQQETFSRTREIIKSCPNLKTLHIGDGFLELVNLPQLWKGLPHLENLYFEGCEKLNDDHFIGRDAEKPAFWSLKNLKVLELVDMELMEVTDELFSKVLSHMPLKELYLVCSDDHGEVKSIIKKGIRSLLSGTFAATVERLSIQGLRIKGVTKEQLKRLENRFRSSKMC